MHGDQEDSPPESGSNDFGPVCNDGRAYQKIRGIHFNARQHSYLHLLFQLNELKA